MAKYETFEHTADEGIIVEGKTFVKTLENTIESFFDYMIGLDVIQNDKKKKFRIVTKISTKKFFEDLENTVVEVLSTMLFFFETKGTILSKAKISSKDGKVCIEGEGCKYNKEKHGFKNFIKAVTYHCLEAKIMNVESNARYWRIKVLFDL